MMKISVIRNKSTPSGTLGRMYIDGVFECFTMEDIIRDVKIKGETAIPKGSYKVIINESFRFKRMLPLLINVPNFEGVRIHAGNTKEDTEGCILVGDVIGEGSVLKSRAAFDRIFKKMQKAKEIELTIA